MSDEEMNQKVFLLGDKIEKYKELYCENIETYNLLFFSSFIFITNVLSTFYKKYYIYCIFFISLTITSLIFHYSSNIYTNILDKFSILAIVLYGSYILYNKTSADNYKQVFVVVMTFLLCIFLFIYGYSTNSYCYHPDKYIGDNYHCLLHCISSFGHHLITFL